MLVSFCVLVSVALGGLRHKDHGQHTKYKRLDDTYKQFEHHDHRRQNGKLSEQTGHDCDQYDPCKHISKQTEGKREDLGKLRDQLQQSDQKIHRTEEWHLEHSARVEEFTQVASALCSETDDLNHHHRDQRQRSGEIQIHGNAPEE